MEKQVLIPVDQNRTSLQAARYAARACVDQFYPRAMDKLSQMGLSKDQIEIHTLEGSRRIGQDVVAFAETNGFNTLVIGRRGIDRSFFMGSVSRQIIGHVSDCAVWIVP